MAVTPHQVDPLTLFRPSGNATGSEYLYESLEASRNSEPHLTFSLLSAPIVPLEQQQKVWPLILAAVDLRTHAMSLSVCKQWRSISILYSTGVTVTQRQLDLCSNNCEKLRRIVSSLIESKSVHDKSTTIEYIAEIAEEEKTWLQSTLERCTDLSSNGFFLLLMHLHQKHLNKALDAVSEGKCTETIAWSLARSLRQMQATFAPKGKVDHKKGAYNIIRDREGRAIWTKLMARRTAPWISLQQLVLALKWPSDQLQHLESILDFPQEGVITAYKWHIFTSMFGPYRSLRSNFDRFVMGHGFAGRISREEAELLLLSISPKLVLIRASRTHPSMIVFSYRSSVEGPFAHLTNNPNFWSMSEFASSLAEISKQRGIVPHSRNVPMDYFVLLMEQSGYSLAPLCIDLPPSPDEVELRLSNLNLAAQLNPSSTAPSTAMTFPPASSTASSSHASSSYYET